MSPNELSERQASSTLQDQTVTNSNDQKKEKFSSAEKRKTSQKPSNIGRNPNPVLVMTPADQRAKVSHHIHPQDRSRGHSSRKHQQPQKQICVLDNDSFPAGLVAGSTDDGNVRFGKIESQLPRIDYSKIATMHAASNVVEAEVVLSSASSLISSQKAQAVAVPMHSEPVLPSQPLESFPTTAAATMPMEQPHFSPAETSPMEHPVPMAHAQPLHPYPPHGQFVPEHQGMHPFPSHIPPWIAQAQQHPFIPPMFAQGQFPNAPQFQPSAQFNAPPGQQSMPYSNVRMMQPMPGMPYVSHPHPHPPSSAAMHVPIVVVPERKRTILEFTDPETGAPVSFDDDKDASSNNNAEKIPLTQSQQQDISQSTASSNEEVKIILIEPSTIAEENALDSKPTVLPEEKEVSQTVLIDKEPEMLSKIIEKLSVAEEEDEDEDEGEIEEDEDSMFHYVTLNNQIHYPVEIEQLLKKEPISMQRISYPLSFLMRFQPICKNLPSDIMDGEYMIGFSGIIGTNYLQALSSRSISSSSATSSGSGRGKFSSKKPSLPSKPSSRRSAMHARHELVATQNIILSENAWSKRSSVASDEDEVVRRKFIGILNKLSRENFEPLYEQIKNLQFSGSHLYSDIICKIYDKAVDESGFAELYAYLVHRLSNDIKTFGDVDPAIIERTGSITRFLLLHRCQTEYQLRNLWNNPDYQFIVQTADIPSQVPMDKPEDVSVEDYWRRKLRKRSLGNIKFIGELFKLGVINEGVISKCVRGLLEDEIPQSEELESLAKLLTTTGAKLDANRDIRESMTECYAKIRKVSESSALPARIKFMLMDLLELRDNRWQIMSPSSEPAQRTPSSSSSRKMIQKKSTSNSNPNPTSTPQLRTVQPSPAPKQVPLTRNVNQSKYSLLERDDNGSSINLKSPSSNSKPSTPPATEAPVNFDEKRIAASVKSTLEEYLHVHDFKEVILSLRNDGIDRFSQQQILFVLSEIFQFLLSKTRKSDVSQLTDLIRYFCKVDRDVDVDGSVEKKIFSRDQIIQSIRQTFATLPDLVIDVPVCVGNAAQLLEAVCGDDPVSLWKGKEEAVGEMSIEDDEIVQVLAGH